MRRGLPAYGAPTKAEAPSVSVVDVLATEVTLVITPKDFFSLAIEALERLWAVTPAVARVLYLDTGPHACDLSRYVDHCERTMPAFERLCFPEMHNFYEMRNAAAAQVRTRYGSCRIAVQTASS